MSALRGKYRVDSLYRPVHQLENSKIKKRDGRIVDFDKEKIIEVIWKAVKAVGLQNYDLAINLGEEVCLLLNQHLELGLDLTVEHVQDTVEQVLVEHNHYEIVKAYILHRALHTQIRELVDSYLNEESWLVRENANMTYSLQGLNSHISSQVISEYWLHRIYKRIPHIGQSHINGSLHIHDLNLLGPYCVGWDLRELLLSGFKGVQGKISSKPAKHFRSILGQIVNFFFTLQGEAAGAQAFSNFDTFLAPYIHFDQLNYKAVKQAVQEFLFNVNVPTRVGFQTPFTNITLDLTVPNFMEHEPIIIGGEVHKGVYGDFQDEMDMFNKAFVDIMLEGDSIGRVFTFPIPTINLTKTFDWSNKIYDGIFELAAKYGTPYFSNFINSDMRPEDVRSMCCHLRLDERELKKRGGGLFGANPLTGSIGVITINMPRIGYLSKDENEFIEKLNDLLKLAKLSLEIKRETLETFTDRGLYPYSRFYLREVKSSFGQYWKNHFSTIGLIGMNECCLNFLGRSIGDREGLKFSEKILDFMRGTLQDFQEETGHIYNLEATPAEGTSYRLAKIDKRKYPNILVANEQQIKMGAEPYYTNSTQLPVNFTNDLFDALTLQESLQTKYSGGTVFHIWLGEKKPSVEAVKTLIRKVSESFRLPYFTLTPTFSICPTHGYLYGEEWHCPKCTKIGRTVQCEVYSRVVGYLRPVDQWNNGKQEEFKQRRTFDTAI